MLPTQQSTQPGLPEGSIDLKQYNTLVAKGAVRLQRIGPATFQMLVKRFDPMDGTELPPAVMPANPTGIAESIKQIEEQIVNLQESLVNLKQAAADMNTMETAGATLGDVISAVTKV